MALRVLLAAALGAAIGFQRERSHRPAGLRTHMLISSGAALFTAISALIFPDGDPSRIAAGVVTGIGFIGAKAMEAIGRNPEYILSVISAVIVFFILLIPHRSGEK